MELSPSNPLKIEGAWIDGAYHEVGEIPEEIWNTFMEKDMPTKKPLPSERNGKTWKAKIDNNAIYVKTGEYEDGSLGEVFIEMYKEGAGYKSILGCFSICVSWLIQYGVPLEKIVDKFVYTRFEPSGIVTGDKEIKMCTSILDYVFRRIAITYLDRQEFNQGKKSELPNFIEEIVAKNPKLEMESKEVPDIQVYTLASGSLGLRPVGYKSAEFLKFCKKHKKIYDSVKDDKFELDFNEDSIVVFDAASNGERDINEIKFLWFKFYGKKLDLGDVG